MPVIRATATEVRSKLDFPPLAIDDDLGWLDAESKPNLSAIIAAAGITEPDEVTRATRELSKSFALDVIRSLIRKRYQASQSPTSISDPNWPYLVAYLEGYRKGLKEIYQLIPIRSNDRNS